MTNPTHEGVIMIRGKGTGFFSVAENTEDVVIDRSDLNFALNGDIVRIELKDTVPGQRQAARVVEVLEPAHTFLIGTVKERQEGAEKQLYLSPDDHRIHIRPQLPEAHTHDIGMKVVVTLANWRQPHLNPTATITEVLGKAGDHETEMQAIIKGGGFSENFPPLVAEAAQKLHQDQQQIFADALTDPKRKDMRAVTTMTIDPVDAKDFDDALSLRQLENGNYEVGIHIADVSHYVEDGGIIDMEARERGTSIYLVDRVIPMLPEVLSNDLCSLRPHEDRLAFSAVFEINADATVVSEWYGQTIIHSDKRFSYEEAQEVLGAASGEFHTELSTLMKLSRIVRKRRHKHGAIAFEQPEVKFRLDEQGVPVEAYTKIRTETMLMIEDFMLLANQSVATHIYKLSKDKGKDAAFVYRIHDVPDPEKIEELSLFIHALGYEFRTQKGMVNPKDINALLKEIEGTPEENLIKTATIRSMAKAVYSTKNIGHYGLAFKFYTHFTSPIRRYPDLMVHRLLRRHLDGSIISGKELAKFEKLSVQSSERELTAVRAERDSIKYKQVEYMTPHVGETFTGVITGVTDWGIYVEEKNSKSEGMIKLASIKGDFFEHEASKYRVKGQKTGKVYRLGDEITVKLTRADMEERQLDFELA
ncbi:MAG: ribonuclease R [Candidatus Paceibacterota bacterium]